ncbi:TPA: hypothetical protein DHT69_00130 [Candidatus Collierbacteria bacterium]|nr:hypothetical protein [Candidatus Collierbacteria bacterium]
MGSYTFVLMITQETAKNMKEKKLARRLLPKINAAPQESGEATVVTMKRNVGRLMPKTIPAMFLTSFNHSIFLVEKFPL